jgi:hypothetical protein
MIRNIDGIGVRCARSRRIDFLGGSLRVGLCAADRGDARPFTGQTNGDSVPNPPPCSGDHCNLILESHP